jgi:small subunit ribosomal protein S19e
MTTLFDVPADALIEAVAAEIDDEIEEPDWAAYTKTGVGRELPPEQEDFWSIRAASLLRKVAVDGPLGVGRLREAYGDSKQGSTRYRTRPDTKSEASGKVIRTILQQLEEAGYVVNQSGGRSLSGEGRALLDRVAGEVMEELDRPELERYA